MNKTRIAIIGHGFVGKAVEYGFSTTNIDTTLIDPIISNKKLSDYANAFDFIFVCVPTPMKEDGALDVTIIKQVLVEIEKELLNYIKPPIVIIKSTVTPNFIQEAGCKISNLVYNPEFLSEANSKHDFVNPDMLVIGSNSVLAINAVEQLYQKHSLCYPAPVVKCSLKEASFIKYGINTFLALKVTYFNQLKELTDLESTSFTKIVNAIASDPRVGSSHTRVPGFDGNAGYGGPCFPKDVNAFVHQYDISILKEAQRINNNYRKDLEVADREKQQNIKFSQ
jgi:UDPglucose 6-dehydrogenase